MNIVNQSLGRKHFLIQKHCEHLPVGLTGRDRGTAKEGFLLWDCQVNEKPRKVNI